jgi:transposase-like protein
VSHRRRVVDTGAAAVVDTVVVWAAVTVWVVVRYQLEADDAADRRNGYYQRHLLTEPGDIELNVPRTRRYSPVEVIRAYARRTPEIDRVILSAFVLGLSTRKVGETLLSILGRPISAETVSQVAKTLYRHGLTGEGLDSGLLAALPIVLHGIPVQRCWAHKIRNILDKVRKADQPKSSAHSTRLHSTRSCMPTINLPRPRPLVSSPIASRKGYPNAVACLRDDLDELLTCFRYKSEEQRRRYEPPTPSNDASAKSGDRLGPWAPSRTKPAWTVSCSPSSLTKTSHKASVPLSC